MKEEYKKIEDIYSISNFGNVRNDTTGRVLKPFIKGRKVVVGLWLYNASQLKQFAYAILHTLFRMVSSRKMSFVLNVRTERKKVIYSLIDTLTMLYISKVKA